MLTIVIPMAGSGSRFAQVGYQLPKPLIPVHGIPMVRLVIENLRPRTPHRFVFICQEEHLRSFNLEAKLKMWAGPNTVVAAVPGLTGGAACTVLSVKDFFNDQKPLMIANCDQYIDLDVNEYIQEGQRRKLDGQIMTLSADHPKWSYVAVDDRGFATKVVEKQVISPHATVGIYNYAQGNDFVEAAEEMIAKNLRTNNEFYVAPAYDQLIARGKKIGIYNIGSEGKGMYGIGTPEDLEAFLALPISLRATAALSAA